jgi:hypothetical protein
MFAAKSGGLPRNSQEELHDRPRPRPHKTGLRLVEDRPRRRVGSKNQFTGSGGVRVYAVRGEALDGDKEFNMAEQMSMELSVRPLVSQN